MRFGPAEVAYEALKGCKGFAVIADEFHILRGLCTWTFFVPVTKFAAVKFRESDMAVGIALVSESAAISSSTAVSVSEPEV